MSSKSNNPDLGAIECDACGGFAAIRRQRTGRQLLYLHCKNCGMDKRSGAKLQAKWERAIGEQQPEPEVDLSPKPLAQLSHDKGEWLPPEIRPQAQQPQALTHETKTSEQGTANERNNESAQRIEHEKNDTSGSNGGLGLFIFGAIAGLAAIAGIRANA
ncbi:hypothetical protein [Pseudoalteromonas sp. MEBiC 03485]|uniref:hypothetical protein n=1 Tax=Pseudoalteromonas sp. MEBiC 03485 TaxID=2571103 RepID=UPI00101FEFC0|nr:hypothetical protein [Pseudoalteromonas sp. MEBiC 03485]RZD19840.1 hypothetical protein EVU92_17110 [Pseudoalteromonas sp. MEBiC 03485]